MLDDSIKENIATAEVYTKHTHTPIPTTLTFSDILKNINQNNDLGLMLINVVKSLLISNLLNKAFQFSSLLKIAFFTIKKFV